MKRKKNEEQGTFIHGYMGYFCPTCGRRVKMWLEKGLEDRKYDEAHPPHHKPVPFMIKCACGNFAQDTTGYVTLDDYYPRLPTMSFFKNDPAHDCGMPVIKAWEEPDYGRR